MESSDDNNRRMGIERLQEALEKTLSGRHIGLLLLYLRENGAIQGEEIDIQRLEEALKELFGEGALIFFELLNDISGKETN